MGASFITEGTEPIRVIASCIIGSAVASSLALFFDCELQAPHGDIFVLRAIKNPLMYAIKLSIGSIITTVLVKLQKKPIEKI